MKYNFRFQYFDFFICVILKIIRLSQWWKFWLNWTKVQITWTAACRDATSRNGNQVFPHKQVTLSNATWLNMSTIDRTKWQFQEHMTYYCTNQWNIDQSKSRSRGTCTCKLRINDGSVEWNLSGNCHWSWWCQAVRFLANFCSGCRIFTFKFKMIHSLCSKHTKHLVNFNLAMTGR